MSGTDYANQVVNNIIQTSKIITNKLEYDEGMGQISWIREHLNTLEKELIRKEHTKKQKFDEEILD